jgi:protein phosphatase PTC7
MAVHLYCLLSLWMLGMSCSFAPPIKYYSLHNARILQIPLAMEPLAREGAWTAYLDEETTGLVYYFNSETGESSWNAPTDTFPEVKVQNGPTVSIKSDPEKTEKLKGDKGGFFDSIFGSKKQINYVVEQEDIVEEILEPVVAKKDGKPPAGLFGNFFGGNKNDDTKEEEYDQTVYEDAVITEDESYNQELYEDAVPVEETDKKKATFVADLMSQFKVEKLPSVPIKPLELDIASKILPHPEKVSWGGEDALCVNSRSFGIFDGVSGAEKLDGVPLYSKTLAQQLKSSMGTEPLTVKDLKAKLLLAAEYADIAATGASTATIASIGEDNILRAVCLGDSPLLVIRNGIIHSRTKDTLHYFDCPYQLSENSPDRPRDASVKEIKLVPGDVIIAGSDGIFDNLEDQAIIDIVNSQIGNKRTTRIVEKIVSESRRVSLDPNAPTPYAIQAKRNRYENYKSGLGGKLDDISCIVVECKER